VVVSVPNLRLALRHLLMPIERDGETTTLTELDPSLSRYRFFEEYPTKPVYYTLNGFMFTLLGIYDWSHVPANTQQSAKAAFDDGMQTLSKTIHLYDVSGYSSYDLSHLIEATPPFMPFSYEAIHVYLLKALTSIKSDAVLIAQYKDWREHLDRANEPLRFGASGIRVSADSPQPVGTPIQIVLNAQGAASDRLYKIGIKHDGQWTFPHPWQANNVFLWIPADPGHYDLGFYVKSSKTKAEFDNFRPLEFEITPRKPK